MANVFKNAALSNVSNGSYDDLYTTPTSTRTVVLGLAITNKTTAEVKVKVSFYDYSSGVNYQLLEDVAIPGNTTLETLAGQKYILETSDKLQVQSNTTNGLDVVMGLMETS